MAIVAAIVGDTLVFPAACALAASLAGFLLVNFPRGRIFLGDGGAYLVGLLLGELAVLLVHRNSEVSPWFPLMLLAYPVWETLFSMVRRKMRGQSTGEADALHFHTLVYRRVVRWRGFEGKPRDYVLRNSIASMCLWIIPAACLLIALASWDNSLPLQLAAIWLPLPYILSHAESLHGPRLPLDGVLLTLAAYAFAVIVTGGGVGRGPQPAAPEAIMPARM